MSSKTVNIIIIAYYLLTLLCGIDSIISNEVINNIRLVFQFGMPLVIVLMILYDNRKNLDIFKQNKISLIFMIVNIVWMLITIIFGIHKGVNSIKGLVNFSSMLLLIYLLSNVKFSKEQTEKIFKHILIAGLICASYGILQYVFKINLDTLSNAKYPGILGRINSTFYLATLYDKYMLLTVAFAGYNVIKNNSKS